MNNERMLDEQLLVTGQPTPHDIEELHRRGVREVINLRGVDEEGYWDGEKAAVEAAGMDYTNIPISPAMLDDTAVSRVHQAIASAGGLAVVHCQGGGRAGVMGLLHLAVQNGWGIQHALDEGRKRGVELKQDSPYRAFFERYLKDHSPEER